MMASPSLSACARCVFGTQAVNAPMVASQSWVWEASGGKREVWREERREEEGAFEIEGRGVSREREPERDEGKRTWKRVPDTNGHTYIATHTSQPDLHRPLTLSLAPRFDPPRAPRSKAFPTKNNTTHTLSFGRAARARAPLSHPPERQREARGPLDSSRHY